MSSRGLFAFSLPLPIARRDFKPMLQDTSSDATCIEYNLKVNAWYINRQTLLDRLVEWQNKMYAAQNSLLPPAAQTLCAELQAIYDDLVLPGIEEWRWIYDYVASRGASFRYCNEFIPEWRVMVHAPVFVVYTQQSTPYNQKIVDPVYHVHSSPAWIFESVCMHYLATACAQLLCLLNCVSGRANYGKIVLESALELNKHLTDSLLPCYFAESKSGHSFLLCDDFHRNYLRPHLQAQLDQITALEHVQYQQEMLQSPAISLCAAVLFSRSCKYLQQASKTFYDTANDRLSSTPSSAARASNVAQNYGSVINYARSCSHHMLAQFFWLCYDNDLALLIDESKSPLVFCTLPDDDAENTKAPSVDNQLLLTNAFYCARSALVQSTVAPTHAVELYTKICETLQNFYQTALPPAPSSIDNGATSLETESIETISCISRQFEYSSVEVRHRCRQYIDLSTQKTFAISLRETNDDDETIEGNST